MFDNINMNHIFEVLTEKMINSSEHIRQTRERKKDIFIFYKKSMDNLSPGDLTGLRAEET